MFNIFISNIFFFVEKKKIYNVAVDNTIYLCRKDPPKVKENLICTMKNILKRFRLNFLKANPVKHILNLIQLLFSPVMM